MEKDTLLTSIAVEMGSPLAFSALNYDAVLLPRHFGGKSASLGHAVLSTDASGTCDAMHAEFHVGGVGAVSCSPKDCKALKAATNDHDFDAPVPRNSVANDLVLPSE